MQDTDDAPDGHMTGGEMQTVREYLGLTADRFAAILGVTARTIRNWEAGRFSIPDGVREDVEQLEADTAVEVGKAVSALGDMRAPAIVVYRTDEAMHNTRPHLAHLGPRWWRHVVARAVTEVPGVEIIDYEDAAKQVPHIAADSIYVGPGAPHR